MADPRSVPFLTRTNSILERLLLGTALSLMILFIVVVAVEVFFRYVLNSSQAWTQETARLAFMWSIFTAAAVAFRHNDHLTVDVVRFRPGSTAHRVHEWVLHVTFFLLLVTYTYLGWRAAQVGMGRSMLIVPLPIAAGWAAIPFMGLFASLFVAERLALGYSSGGHSFDPPRAVPQYVAGEERELP